MTLTRRIGLPFERRFWEEDDAIFGGISRTDRAITPVVYSSSGYFGQKGELVGALEPGRDGAKALHVRAAQDAPQTAVA